jgi:hypothetical protein
MVTCAITNPRLLLEIPLAVCPEILVRRDSLSAGRYSTPPRPRLHEESALRLSPALNRQLRIKLGQSPARPQ